MAKPTCPTEWFRNEQQLWSIPVHEGSDKCDPGNAGLGCVLVDLLLPVVWVSTHLLVCVRVTLLGHILRIQVLWVAFLNLKLIFPLKRILSPLATCLACQIQTLLLCLCVCAGSFLSLGSPDVLEVCSSVTVLIRVPSHVACDPAVMGRALETSGAFDEKKQFPPESPNP